MHHTSDKIIIGLLIISILIGLYGCEVEFTPDITPLSIEDISPDQPFEEIPGQESEFAFPLDGTSKIYLGLTSDMAIDLCTEHLLWGDEVFGMCLPPGGMYYFFWTQEDDVFIIELDPQDPNQVGFREAVHDRASNIKKAKQNFNRLVPRGLGFLATVFGIPFACGTGVLCAIDIAGVLASGGLTADSVSNIIDGIIDAVDAQILAQFYACRLEGGNDMYCREKVGIEE